jgi:O-antigen ligase
MSRSPLRKLLFGYESSEAAFASSKTARAEKKLYSLLISGVGAGHLKKLFASPVSRFFKRLSDTLSHTTVRSFGALMLSFSIVNLLLNLSVYYADESVTEIPLIVLVCSAIFGIIAIPLLAFDVPLPDALSSVRPIEFILFEVLCIKRTASKDSDSRPVPTLAMIFIGILIGVVGFFAPLAWVLTAILITVFAFMAMSSPEFSLMLTVFSLPFIQLLPHPTIILTVATAVSAISFALKVMLGKRNYHFEQYDVLILIFAAFILVSGVFNGGISSFENALVMAVLTLAYPLASNLISNRRLADNITNLIVASSAPVAIYAICSYFFLPAHPEWMDPSFQGTIAARAVGTFSNPNVYAVFLLIACAFSAIFTLDKHRKRTKALHIAALALNLTALVLTWTRGAWLALILALIAAPIISRTKLPRLFLIPLVLVPAAITLFAPDVVARILSIFDLQDSSISSRLSVWRSSLAMLSDRPILGSGIGEKSFVERFLIFAEDGVTAPHSHNLFLEIGIEAGVIALFIFVLILLARLRHAVTYSAYTKRSSVGMISVAASVATFALLTFGMTDYIWYNSSMYFAFFAVFGINSATLRISRQEYGESMLFTGSEYSAYSASTDISILH